MSFDQREFLDRHIPYRLGNLDLFDHSLRIILSEPAPQEVRIIFDGGHELRGPYRIFTNLAVEAGLINCRSLLEFLEAEKKYPKDVVITMFQRTNRESLTSVPLSTVANFHPLEFSESETLAALQFTKQAADKAVAHLTLGPPEPEGDQVTLFQLACYAIREALKHHLYEELGLPAPERIIEDIKRGESELS